MNNVAAANLHKRLVQHNSYVKDFNESTVREVDLDVDSGDYKKGRKIIRGKLFRIFVPYF